MRRETRSGVPLFCLLPFAFCLSIGLALPAPDFFFFSNLVVIIPYAWFKLTTKEEKKKLKPQNPQNEDTELVADHSLSKSQIQNRKSKIQTFSPPGCS